MRRRRRGKEEVLLLTTTLFSIFNDGNAFAVLIGACKWENLVSLYVAWGYKSRARARKSTFAHPSFGIFLSRGRRDGGRKEFSRESAKTHTHKRRQIFTLADKPCVEQTLFEKFNRVGVDAANDIIIYGSYYGLKWRIPNRNRRNVFLEESRRMSSFF